MDNNNILSLLLEKQTQMVEDIGEIKGSLAYHIKRTDLAEESTALLRKQIDINQQRLENDLKPIKAHINMVDAGLKILGYIGLIVGIISGLIKIFS